MSTYRTPHTLSESQRRRLGKAIQSAREAANLSVVELSAKLQLSRGAIYQIERGEVTITLPTLVALARACRCTPGTILDQSLPARRSLPA